MKARRTAVLAWPMHARGPVRPAALPELGDRTCRSRPGRLRGTSPALARTLRRGVALHVSRWATGLIALSGALARLWLQIHWIGGMSDHCDYPEECRAHWFPQVFTTADTVWLIATAVGLATRTVGWRLAASTATIAVTAVGIGTGFVAYLFTQTWQWRGDLDGFFRWYGPRWDTGYLADPPGRERDPPGVRVGPRGRGVPGNVNGLLSPRRT